MRPSSTSSSERPPWAGLWAAVVVISIDLLLFSSWGPWETLKERVPDEQLLPQGIARGRVELRRLAAVPEGTARVVLVGTSRAQVGFVPRFAEELERDLPPLQVAKLTHAGMDAFAIRSLADELMGYHPDVVVLLLSEFDTHAPLYPRVTASFGSFSAVLDLASAVGAKLGFEARAHFYRLALATVLDSYRYRDLVEWAGARALRSFPLAEPELQLELKPSPAAFPYTAGEPSPLDARRRRQLGQEIERRFSGKSLRGMRWQAQRVHSLTRGDHAEIQMRLVRRAVERLRAAGAGVIIVEGPLSPLAAEYYDPTIREDFVAFARGLARAPGVRFVPLKVNATYPEEEFADLTHVNAAGARKLTAEILRALKQVLEERG